MNFLPYRLLKRADADALSARAAAALARWGARWAALPDHAVSCAEASEAALAGGAPALRRRVLTNGLFVWAQVPAGAERTLEQLLFGLGEMDATSDKHQSSRFAAGSVEAALEDLLQMLVEALCGQASAPASFEAIAPHLLRRGAGSVACSVVLGSLTVRLLLPASVLSPAAPLVRRPGAEALATLHRALGELPVPLSVEVCQTELTLGYLRTLAVGDVLALPVGVDQAMRVTGPGDTTVCHAHLGALSGFHAVELMKLAP